MKAPLNWLLSYTDLNIEGAEAVHDFAEKITVSGTKVESVIAQGEEIKNVVVGKCMSCSPHENSDHLQICMMDVGTSQMLQIVTGAPNVRVGAYIPVALDGAVIAEGQKIKKGKLRGVDSFGMMCSFQELGLNYKDYEGGIEDGVMIIQDLKDFEEYDSSQLDLLKGKNIMEVLGVCETVIDFEVTSNRADCFSILGLAREAAMTMNGHFTQPELELREECQTPSSQLLKVDITAPDLCARYIGRVVKDVVIAPSPKWMRQRLQAAGIRAINNIVDITNYVMLEYGQPMHAFDRRTIRGGNIIVRRAQEGEEIKTLDGNVRTLDSNMLVIADPEGPLAIAGVMGGENSEIEPDTTEIVFESAIFDAVTVRRGAKKVGLRTESSSRFEKGLDTVTARKAIDRACQLVEMLNAGKVCKGMVDAYPNVKKERQIKCSVEGINAFLGIDATLEEMTDILTGLECEAHLGQGYVIPPSFREDLVCYADIAEEIARFYGYNNIKSSLLKGCETTKGHRTAKQKLTDKVRHFMANMGYHEILTFSFISPSVFDKMRLDKDSELRDAIRITNPLGEDFSVMRTTMIPSLMETLSNNRAHRLDRAEIFEISYVYVKMSEDLDVLPEHRELLSFGSYASGDFYDIKGNIEALLGDLKITDYEFVPETSNASFHPGRTANILIKGEYAGTFGQIHPLVAEAWECPADTFVGFINTSALLAAAEELPQNKELPRFPAVERDLAIVLDKDVPAGQVAKVINQRGGIYLESCKFFDVYEGLQLGVGKKSLAYALTFRAPDRTLTDEDVARFMKKILNGLETNLGATLR